MSALEQIRHKEAASGNPGWSLADEMRSARSVQARLLPAAMPALGGLECAGICLPERGVGGDFYDFFGTVPGRMALVIGDVSGKGVPAALMMATLQASLRSSDARAPLDIARLLGSVNRSFFRCTAYEHYASLFIGAHDEESGRFLYANCGHVPPVVLRRDLRVERLTTTATPLGMFEDWTCRIAETSLSEEDLVLLVSDGATESENVAGEAFGDDRLLAALYACRDLRTTALVRRIADEVRAFRDRGAGDDLTIVAARVRRRSDPARCSDEGEGGGRKR